MKLPGASQLKHLKNLMLSRPFLRRIPDQNLLLSTTPNDLTRVQFTRDGTPGRNDASYVMAYFPQHVEAMINTSKIASPALRGWWFNPRDGTSKSLGKIANDKQMKFSPPTNVEGEDWVLVLDDPAKNFPPPGMLN